MIFKQDWRSHTESRLKSQTEEWSRASPEVLQPLKHNREIPYETSDHEPDNFKEMDQFLQHGKWPMSNQGERDKLTSPYNCWGNWVSSLKAPEKEVFRPKWFPWKILANI